jgi:hypothetical protein
VSAARRAFARSAVALGIALFVAGCASVPQASAGRDAEAKQFHTHPATAAIYVYRTDFGYMSEPVESTLWIDRRLVGSTLPRTFFRVDARPGRRVLHGDGHDAGEIALDTAAGELYFVSLDVSGGTSRFERVPAERAKREILRCCALMENWAPGQRPLLR